jgi:chromate reductase
VRQSAAPIFQCGRPARAQDDLWNVFVFLDAHVLNRPEITIGGAAQKFDGAGMLTDAATRQFIGQQVTTLRDWGARVRP